ncbi:MAG: bifunctional phosphopantothenoylcysteine decarboxylase/phosphopantothenate--cysteine ligase CoaBC [Desulfurococcales archaeon]|nr:bifunctional phosphopantothenoylcysteine decarboxylase/phosphopantothenate--cysteine ligase CoaBC [Desulfurococcales archaeon]
MIVTLSYRHPTMDIKGEINNYLEGKCVILGVTGSVAIYRAIDTARWLIRRGAYVKTVMTSEAAKLVTPQLFHWATGEKPLVEFSGDTEHIGLARECDSMLVAPATLSTLSKIAYGIVDNPVALTAISILGYGKPLLLVPAMHGNMYSTPHYKHVINRLEEVGAVIIPPKIESGVARYPEPWIVGRITAALTYNGRDMLGTRILVTAGATREWLDKVRFLSNPSSGRMGVEVGLEAWARGSIVDLVHGVMGIDVPHVFNRYKTESTSDMASKVRELTTDRYDAFVASAAPVDFTPSKRFTGKLKSGISVEVEFKPTPKVIEAIRSRPIVLVAFAAETTNNLEELEKLALEKLDKYNADYVVANIVGVPDAGFGSEYSRAIIIDKERSIHFKGKTHKEILARIIIDLIKRSLRNT